MSAHSVPESVWERRLTDENILWTFPHRGPHAAFVIGDRHSGAYFNSDVLFSKPELLEEIADWFFAALASHADKIEAVVAKAPYSTRLAAPLAKRLQVPVIRFGEDPIEGLGTALIFTDDIYGGALVGEIMDALGDRSIGPIAVVANYSGCASFRGQPVISLVQTSERSPAWSPAECPLCASGSPVIPARDQWSRLVASAARIPASFRAPAELRHFVERCLSVNPARVAHVLEIAKRVRRSASKLGLSPADTDLAECAALLHDIGYWEPIAQSGFHPIDGARFLTAHGEPQLARFVVGHSCSPEEAAVAGISGVEQDSSLIAKLITYWDVQVKQGGEVVSYEERLADILARYGEDSAVGRANLLARPRIERLMAEMNELLNDGDSRAA